MRGDASELSRRRLLSAGVAATIPGSVGCLGASASALRLSAYGIDSLPDRHRFRLSVQP